MISIVSAGELRTLATVHAWGEVKLDRMEYALGYFDIVPIDSDELVRTYAGIDAAMRDCDIRMGKNDLWIAATTLVTGAHLLTLDTDFLPLIPSVIPGECIDPSAP